MVNSQVLTDLAKIGKTNNSKNYAGRLLDIYRSQSEDLLGQLEQAISASDSPEIIRCSHKLAGSSVTLGASKLAEDFIEIQESAKFANFSHDEMDQLFENIQRTYTDSLGLLEKIVQDTEH